MQKISLLKNTIQEYAWGSPKAIPDLLGQKNPGNKPQAELWMGAHPKAPSLVKYQDQWVSLLDVISKNPVSVLGKDVARNFKNQLPYLFKILAAARPLSIQAHPNRDQARQGFRRENTQKVPLDAPERNYRDANHKPECICALTPFWALSRFRRIPGILSYLEKVCPDDLEVEIESLKQQPTPDGLKRFYTALMTMDADRQKRIVSQALEQARRFEAEDPVFEWMLRIAGDYPNDIGALAPIFLNLVCLKPGQALFLDAGELHAYLEGLGIELMANSDNVLRGGLTPKHVDVPELLRILRFEDRDVTFLKSREVVPNELAYPCPVEEFKLSVITLKAGSQYQSAKHRSIEILICTRGTAGITDDGGQTEIRLQPGVSVVIPAAVAHYAVRGEGTFYKAAVPTVR